MRANGRAHARLVCEQFHPTRVGALTPVPTRNDRVGPDSTLSAPLRSQTRIHVLATRIARALRRHCPSKTRGSRECRVRAAPAVSCASCTKKCAHEHTGSAEAIRHSLRNGFTAYAALSPATNSSCHRRCRLDGSSIRSDRCRHRQLGTSNGCRDHTVLPYAATRLRQEASPGFGAVRPARRLIAHERLALRSPCAPTLPRPPHPLPRFVTTAIRPSFRERMGELVALICPTA